MLVVVVDDKGEVMESDVVAVEEKRSLETWVYDAVDTADTESLSCLEQLTLKVCQGLKLA